MPVTQVNCFPAEVVTEPAAAVIPDTSAVGYVIVHCRAVGWAPPAEDRVRFRVAIAPGAALDVFRLRVAVPAA